jgi:hypothetical protein
VSRTPLRHALCCACCGGATACARAAAGPGAAEVWWVCWERMCCSLHTAPGQQRRGRTCHAHTGSPWPLRTVRTPVPRTEPIKRRSLGSLCASAALCCVCSHCACARPAVLCQALAGAAVALVQRRQKRQRADASCWARGNVPRLPPPTCTKAVWQRRQARITAAALPAAPGQVSSVLRVA